jgi:hypothetical protein
MDVEEPENFSGYGLIYPFVIQSPAVSQGWPVTAAEQGSTKVRTCTELSMP